MRWPAALLLGLGAFLFWWGMYSSTPINIRGIKIESVVNESRQDDDFFKKLAKFSGDLPMGFRPMVGWLVTGTENAFVKPLFNAFDASLRKTELVIRLSSTFVLGLAYIYAFAILATTFPPFYGFLATIGFAGIPMLLPIVGLAVFDPLVLLFWAFSIRYLSLPYKASDPKSEKINLRNIALLAMAGSWAMENTGVGFSITLFILALMQKAHGDTRPYWKMWAVSTATTLSCLTISWILTHLKPDAYWNVKGAGMGDMVNMYGKYYDYYKQWDGLFTMLKMPLSVAMIGLPISFFLGPKKVRPDAERGRRIFFIGIAALIGFTITTLPGRYIVGFAFEWTRQFLPFAFLGTWIIYGGAMAIMGKTRQGEVR